MKTGSEGCGLPTACFNPLALYRDDIDRIVDEARRLANALIVRTGEEKEPFWNSAAGVILTCVLSFLMAEANPEEATLNRLRDIVSSPKLMNEMLDFLEKRDTCGGLLRRMAGQIRYFQGQMRVSACSVANTHIAFWIRSPWPRWPVYNASY